MSGGDGSGRPRARTVRLDGRTLPNNWEIERALLGGLLQDWQQIHDVREKVAQADFHRPSHAEVYRLLLEQADRGGFDLPTVLDAVAGDAETYGGLGYVSNLPNHCPSTENLGFYAERVRAHAVRRGLILAAQRIITAAQEGEKELGELVADAEGEILGVTAEAGTRQDCLPVGPVARALVAEFEARRLLHEEARKLGKRFVVTGVTTGFVDLDGKLAGLQKSDLIILAARPAMGKSAFALNVAMNAARGGVGVGVFSLEMGREQLVTRLICSDALVDASKVRIGDLDRDQDWPQITDSVGRLSSLPIYIDDTSGLTISQLRSKARRLKREHPELGLIVVDYLQLMQGTGGPKESREQVISTISRGMKILAKELDIPIIALSQLNRSLESRTDKRPMPSDLRESGAIEQDADIILFIYRDEVYNEDSDERGVAEIIVAKQRNGPMGTVKLAFLGQYTLFRNYADPRHLPEGYA